MKIIYGIENIRKFRRPVVALGVFDGMHRGHRRILKETAARARRIKGTGVVLTFWPHPQKEASLYSFQHRLRLIAQMGIDVCIVARFSVAFSRMEPRVFVEKVLVSGIGVTEVQIGRNFRFGRGMSGSPALLKSMGRSHHFAVRIFDMMRSGGAAVSSSRIRRLITGGKLKAAERLLSKPVTVLGVVVKGDSIATKLGFPTANIDPHHEVLPPAGIYAVRVTVNGKVFGGVCYIGGRPTIVEGRAAGRRRNIEVHIFDFGKDIYGQEVEIEFLKKIRDEKKFATPESLVERIKVDVSQARCIFSSHQRLHHI